MGEDVNDPGYQLLSEEQIAQQVRNEVAPAEDDGSDGDPEEPNIPSNGEAAEMLDKCMRCIEHREVHHLLYSCMLKSIRDLGIKKRYSHLK